MKFVIVFAALLSVALGAAVDSSKAETLRYENDNIGLDSYGYSVETSDGKKHNEQGVLKNVGAELEGLSVTGSFSYIGDDGVTYTVNYIADENGFQPVGDHLPQAPQPIKN